MQVKTLDIDMNRLKQGVKLIKSVEKKLGQPVAIYIGTYCSLLRSVAQATQAFAPQQRPEIMTMMETNFIAAMIAMDSPDGHAEALCATLETMKKVDALMVQYVKGLDAAGAETEDIMSSVDKLHDYLNANLDLSEEINSMENA